MKTIRLLTSIVTILFLTNSYSQNIEQTFVNAGFKIKSGCELTVNTTFMQMAQEQGMTNVLAAYVCAENQDYPDIGVINNINIYDESKSYNGMKPSEYSAYEKQYLAQYATNLKNAGYNFNYSTFQGVSAIEYLFDQQGLPTKAIIFLKNKKSYLLQVGTRKNLSTKYNTLKANFVIL